MLGMIMVVGAILEGPRSPGAWTPLARAVVHPMESSPSRPAMSAEATARFRRMVDGEFAFVWRFLRGLGVPASGVDDAAQHVFLVASQRLEGITLGSERAFLLATACGVAANARRAQTRSREVLDDERLAEHSDDRADPEQAAAAKQARKLLDSFLEGLPDEAREVFVLFELEGMTMAAIAETLDLPPGTVASRLRRGREEFQAATKRFQAHRAGGRGR